MSELDPGIYDPTGGSQAPRPRVPNVTTPGAQLPDVFAGPVTPVGPTVPAPVVPAAPEEPPAGLSDIMQRMLNVSSSDVDYLRGDPYSTTEEQGMRARMQDRVRNEFGTARQRLSDQLGTQQGMSGVLAGALDRLGEAEASEMSSIDRDLMIKAADEMRSRRGESRGIMTGLEGLERQRMMESLGLGQSIDESERSGLNDLMAAMGMAPNPAQATGAASNMLQYASALGQNATNQSAANIQSISGLADIFSKLGWLK